jgi:hypothetical protein
MTQDYALERFKEHLPLYRFCKIGEIRYILDIIISEETYIIRCKKVSETKWQISYDKEGVDVKNFSNSFFYDTEKNAVF